MASKPVELTVAGQPFGDGNKPPKGYVPEGYETVEDFLKEAREFYHEDREADKANLDAALEDLEFASGDQWDPTVRALRDNLGQPCLTINTLPQFIGQVVGDRRINKTSIKVLARENSDVDIASVRGDLIRNIEAQSRAERVYGMAFEQEVTCGIGYFRIDLDYADDDVFDRDLFIRPIANPLSVTMDGMSIDPTGRDGRRCFVDDVLPRKFYDKSYPDDPPSEIRHLMPGELYASGWVTRDIVRVTEYWRMIQRPRRLALMADGKTLDITDKDWSQIAEGLYRDEQGEPRIRVVQRKYAQMHLITGFAILTKPYELPINRLPIIRCAGREMWVGDRRVRYSLTRFAKDPARQKNFWRSVATEVLSKAPRNQWLAGARSIEGRQHDFRQAYLSGDPVLVWNDANGASPPVLQPPPPVPAALLNEAQMNAQDMKDVTGIHDASLGIRSNETSGIAIARRQNEGDVATVIYHDNMNAAVQEGGDVINQLIPYTFDTARTLRIIGPEEEAKLIRVNDPNDPDSVDLTRGKYDIAISTGPAHATRRQEAAASMMDAVRVFPQLMEVAGDLIAKAQDWPGADQIAERLAKAIPPQLRGEGEGEGAPGGPVAPGGEGGAPTPEQLMQLQQMQQLQEAEAQARMIEQAKAAAELRKIEAEADAAEAKAQQARFDAQKAEAQAHAAEAQLHGGIAKTIDELSGAGVPVSSDYPAPAGDATGA